MQRKKFEGPKIAMLNIELELKSEKENAELRIENVEVCLHDWHSIGEAAVNWCVLLLSPGVPESGGCRVVYSVQQAGKDR